VKIKTSNWKSAQFILRRGLTAIKSDTRLLLFHHEGKHSIEDAIKLLNGVEKMRSASSPIPVFTSDDWDAFKEGFINVYGKIELLQYKGIGRKPLPKLVPLDDLKYVKVLEKKIKNYVVEIFNVLFLEILKKYLKCLELIRMITLVLHM